MKFSQSLLIYELQYIHELNEPEVRCSFSVGEPTYIEVENGKLVSGGTVDREPCCMSDGGYESGLCVDR